MKDMTETHRYAFKSVMVIDDSAVQRQHAVEICAQFGLDTVAEAANGKDALEKLQQLIQMPDLLLIDLEMPVMDGITLIQKLSETGHDFSILILSSREVSLIASVETMVKAYGLPIVGAIHKPLAIEQMQKVLTKYQQRQTHTKPQGAGQLESKISLDDIEDAIEKKQFIVHFQPKVFIASGLIKGVETLVRWEHPEKGLIYPNDFIPQAESSGLIHDITLQVIDLALSWLSHWQAKGLKLTVAINLSAASLSDTELVEQIHQRVLAFKISPSDLVLEITETAVMNNLALSLNSLARLRLNGFGLSIDDYGTGFSSMQQLARIPFTELKIDRSFVDGAADNPQLENMVNISIDTARRLNLACVAEGIESAEDWRFLKKLECEIGQGYFIAKPMRGEELINWIKSQNSRLRNLK
jgi:EAL domain-containing protein (putative c-di-GMP-specific phosphodiesterase class I)/CheY-like chemotaxis protein